MKNAAGPIPAEDRRFREEVLAYLSSRYARASHGLRESQWESFREFVDLWLDMFDWRTDRAVADYLALPEEQRRERYERFRRQADSWDVTLEFPLEAEESATERRARWREEFAAERRRVESRQAAGAARWEEVRRLLESEHALRRLPDSLRESYRLLELPPQATLAEARRRYRELARRHHPDTTGSHESMKALNEAWREIAAFFHRR